MCWPEFLWRDSVVMQLNVRNCNECTVWLSRMNYETPNALDFQELHLVAARVTFKE